MKTVPAILTVLLAVTTASAQNRDAFGGTFIGAMISTDGIVVASDSRSTFVESGKHIGYIDGMPKIHVSHGAAVAVSGLTSVEDELFSSFMRRNDFLLDRPADEILFDVALRLPFRNSTGVLLLSAGFLGGEPLICGRTPTEPQTCRSAGYIANKNSPGLRRWIEARSTPPSSEEAAAALKQAILEAGDLDAAIGGPVSALLLTRSGTPRWLENPPNDRGWMRVCDVVAAYRSGRAQILFTNTKAELDAHLGRICPR